jgi:hypothetical protein
MTIRTIIADLIIIIEEMIGNQTGKDKIGVRKSK